MSESVFKRFPVKASTLIGFFLIAAIVLIYLPVTKFGFVDYDDVRYVVKNTHVKNGLTINNIKWAFFAFYEANWHPVTWISHMMDVQIFGMDPGMFHVINIIFHTLNSLLLFLFFNKATGRIGASAIISVLFAIHPVHVESVAWIAERKDVLSTFFLMLTLLSYLKYVISKKKWAYFSTLSFFSLGLMSKPMIVTLPCLLLLLDYWPLCRLFAIRECCVINGQDVKSETYPIIEKIPFFLLSIFSSWITVVAQQADGAVASENVLPYTVRIQNSFISYFKYIGNILYPTDLSVIYPYPDEIPFGLFFIAFAMTVLFVSISFYYSKSKPYIAFGVFWFLGTLVPVIGILQVGSQAMADRYLYIPAIGVYVIIAMFWHDLFVKYKYIKKWVVAILAGFFVFLVYKASVQTTYWKDGVSLFEHAINVTEKNYIAHDNLGRHMASLGKIDEAISHYRRAIDIMPNESTFHNYLAAAYKMKGDYDSAIKHFEIANNLNPRQVESLSNMASIFYEKGDFKKSLSLIEKALKINPNDYSLYYLMGCIMLGKGAYNMAQNFFFEALKLSPENPDIYNNIGVLFLRKGRPQEALLYFSEALRIDSSNMIYQRNYEAVTHINSKKSPSFFK